MTEDQLRHMAARFCSWPLPSTFRPDGGIVYQHTTDHEWPSGTNLLTFEEALGMVRHMVEDLPPNMPEDVSEWSEDAEILRVMPGSIDTIEAVDNWIMTVAIKWWLGSGSAASAAPLCVVANDIREEIAPALHGYALVAALDICNDRGPGRMSVTN